MERFSQFLLLLIFHYYSTFTCYSLGTNIDDQSSLVARKSHITSDPHNMLSNNWTTEASVCSWIGVGCDPISNRVTALNISNMELVGIIPPEIGNLSFLISLDMNGNDFHGPIPRTIFKLPFLQVLELRNNSLSGTLPHDICKHGLGRLRRICISFNEFGPVLTP